VDGGLGVSQVAEGLQSQSPRPLRQRAARQDLLDVGQVAVDVFLRRDDVNLRCREAALAHLLDVQADGQAQRAEAGPDRLRVDSRVDEGGQRHVAADAAEAVEVQGSQGRSSLGGFYK